VTGAVDAGHGAGAGADPGVDPRRALPAVDELARAAPEQVAPALARLASKRVLSTARASGAAGTVPSDADLRAALAADLDRAAPLRTVLNATGVLLHTNLGRAPIGETGDSAEHHLGGTVDLELDLASGRRGRRLRSLDDALCALTGAEDALVVNNNCAALVLALAALAGDGEVVVSRGQLVEIGGSFRIPDVIASGGARLAEVGTTNRTHPADYRQAIGDATRLLLEVHPSNYLVQGFVHRVPTAELAHLAHEHGLPLLVDLGSGLLDDRCPWLPEGPPDWLAGEPAARQTLRSGADLVTFSGDKLLGGPQAGIVCGRADLVDALRRHPLARALRFDKVRGALLQRTLDAYLRGTAASVVPFWRMATAELASLQERAEAMAARLPAGLDPTAVPAEGAAGAGSLPGRGLPGAAVALTPSGGADHLAEALRRGAPPALAVIVAGSVLLHLRSLDPADDERLVEAVHRAARSSGP